MTNEKKVEYVILPRMCALSEILWTQPERKDYTNFLQRLEQHFALFNLMGVNYCWEVE